MKSLIYTIAFDDGPIPYHRWMAMMLISSLQRSETMRTQDLLQAGLLHFCGIGTAKKLQRMLGYYVMLYGESLAPFLFETMQG